MCITCLRIVQASIRVKNHHLKKAIAPVTHAVTIVNPAPVNHIIIVKRLFMSDWIKHPASIKITGNYNGCCISWKLLIAFISFALIPDSSLRSYSIWSPNQNSGVVCRSTLKISKRCLRKCFVYLLLSVIFLLAGCLYLSRVYKLLYEIHWGIPLLKSRRDEYFLFFS